ncbi:MAG TPA: ROK family protein [Bacteroidota bacterium]|nr:ROK family protein [Bacteroidota bacterium]
MNAPQRLAIGVDLGGTTIKTGLVSANGSILYQSKFPSRSLEGPSAVLEEIERSIHDAMTHTGGNSIAGVGIGAPGVVDRNGVVQSPPNFKDWDAFPLASELRAKLNMEVRIENDANAAAIAESRFGAGRDYPNFLFVIWGTGVGGGIILERRIFRGPSGGAGEIGHISIDYQGPQCNCGSRGCVEAYIGQRYLTQRTIDRLKDYPNSKILQLVGGEKNKIEPAIISKAAHEDDPLAKEILLEAGELLGVAVGAVMNVFDLRVSIIGGGISGAGQFVLDRIQSSVRAHVLKHLRPEITVLQAQLGNEAGILGAAGLVL